ncbi:family 78 glycoside hydrolase catalytic domain [Bacillus sp. FJAT-49732]|uniref:alpha-L-rhamnosidase n=1 Tax=Lederbergia citrisecunda TaxID=2833583 RepID=A0A942TMK8_9BACI|nr:family 78 glycoside hydrolase catalytic domain [Lederbergia citrisecunda]MBS4198644.1 family 78 glycoside hydrolase catalytic domain [Lederbergia citrisecunda]
MFNISDVRCEYKKNPIGIDVVRPRISWKLESDHRGVVQSSYQIQVAEDQDFVRQVWDSEEVKSDQSIHIEIKDVQVTPRTRYYYRVQAWNQHGEGTGWSETSFWETGLLNKNEWSAEWISSPSDLELMDGTQSPILHRNFSLNAPVSSARIYATALGIYNLQLNGEKIGDAYFTPGWTNYNERLQYQTYDVTALLRSGNNDIEAMIGNGWYKGELAWSGAHSHYGNRLAFLFQMHVVLNDGTEIIIRSDNQWQAAASPILMSEIYHGETYDARLEQKEKTWKQVEVISYTKDILVAQENDHVRKIEEIKPIALSTTPKDEVVLDMGQNMVGWLRFSVQGDAGQEVKLIHAEVLNKDGNFYMDNIRTAKQTNQYILKGGEKEIFEPHFTFQGFRYVQLIGFTADQLHLDNFTGVVLHSDMEPTGSFECSDPMINQLQHNILWGLKGNFLDVPTDCPQRDERLGWTGDAQMFIRTSTFLMNVVPFFTKWLRDLESDQAEDGGVPFVVPNVLGKEGMGEFPPPFSSAAWGDATVICPWTIYLVYGDERLLEEQYESMKAWVEYIRRQGENEFLWNTGFHFGDWLALDSKPDSYVGATDRDYIATAFYAYSTSLLQKTATILEKVKDAEKYAELHSNIVKAFNEEFVTPAGRLSVPTQTAQLLALMFELVEGRAKDRAVEKLMELLKESNFHLTTGFVGTPYLNHVLSENGQNEAAYKLLFQKDYPSWLYQVTKGATTIWEHWDGIKEDGSFWSADMNSFNHYAYGAIGDWLYRKVVGIDMDEQHPAYKKSIIKPLPGKGLTYAKGKLETMYGTIASSWTKRDDGTMEFEVTIPTNTSAEIILPNASRKQILESNYPLKQSNELSVTDCNNEVKVLVGSGSYRFTY